MNLRYPMVYSRAPGPARKTNRTKQGDLLISQNYHRLGRGLLRHFLVLFIQYRIQTNIMGRHRNNPILPNTLSTLCIISTTKHQLNHRPFLQVLNSLINRFARRVTRIPMVSQLHLLLRPIISTREPRSMKSMRKRLTSRRMSVMFPSLVTFLLRIPSRGFPMKWNKPLKALHTREPHARILPFSLRPLPAVTSLHHMMYTVHYQPMLWRIKITYLVFRAP